MPSKTTLSQSRLRRNWLDVVISWVQRQRAKWVRISLVLGIVTAFVAMAVPARALQVRLSPSNPALGDTLSILIEQDPSMSRTPNVKMGQKTYPAFITNSGEFRVLLPTSPLDQPGTLQLQVETGSEVKSLTVPLRNRSFPTQRIRLTGAAGANATQHELDRVAAFKSLETPEKYWNGPFLRPNSGRVSSGYGIRRYYNGVFAKDYYHRGVDYAGGMGSPVVAPADGRVALVGRVADGFRVHGNVVGIDHGQGVTSIMMHLSRIDVREGQMVKPGQRIGAIGSTGASTGPHLHWGLYVHGISVDPVPWRETGFE